MDISVKKATKDFMQPTFITSGTYTEKVAEQFGDNTDMELQLIEQVNLALKSVGVKWLVQMHE